MTRSHSSRNALIDILRGVSILLVICSHFSGMFRPNLSWISTDTYLNAVAYPYYGVTIFFTISGFLITSNTIRRYKALATISPLKFYRLRFARIYPVLCLLVIVLCLLGSAGVAGFTPPAGFSLAVTAWKAISFQFNLYHVAGASSFLPWGPLWSLAIEEQFYFVFPLICIVLRRDWLIAAALVAVIVYAAMNRTEGNDLFYFTTVSDALALGCLGAMLNDRLATIDLPRWSGVAIFAAGLVFMTLRYFWHPLQFDLSTGPTLIAVGATISLIGASIAKIDRCFPPVEFIGRRSYELYLIHFPILVMMRTTIEHFHIDLPGDTVWLFFMTTTIAISAIVGLQFTDPMNKLIVGLASRRAQLAINTFR